jgi:leukotriene-A4 hydrolase
MHSWFGNLVTCQNWTNFWLNEGFTVYSERKVSALIYDQEFSRTNSYLGNEIIKGHMQLFEMEPTYTSLSPVLEGSSPEDAFSMIPYEKGF